MATTLNAETTENAEIRMILCELGDLGV